MPCRPFAIRFEGNASYADRDLERLLFKDRCFERHDYLLDNLEQYVNIYEYEPKFSLTWLSEIAHDDINGQ